MLTEKAKKETGRQKERKIETSELHTKDFG